MRGSNWHEQGGNAKQLKGTEQEALAEHANTPQITGKIGRGSVGQNQPTHKQALYPVFNKRSKA